MSVVFKKDESVENEDVWDDTELIKMYEDSVSATYSKLGGAATSKSWSVGDSCLARYSDDDLFYPAKILEIREQKGPCTEYLVLYEGYGNSEWVSADDLMVASSEEGSQDDGNITMDSAPDDTLVTESVRVTKVKRERPSRKTPSSSSRNGPTRPHPSIPSIAPPPPMVMPRLAVPDEAEALSSMLMAWYMSGYHTGYYQAIRDMNANN
ncbi:unnamed protein product [Cylicocyclus nassatus]|uniref:Tudor domain-containing protein n=1 Tax=Cylicocyclus nassatus TaxID=53992 RepID=A0AA36GL85_CYLNA|nr:unnamed protein product [Cylicocyclus nassatus]